MRTLLLVALLVAAGVSQAAPVYRCTAPGKATHYAEEPVAGMTCETREHAPTPVLPPTATVETPDTETRETQPANDDAGAEPDTTERAQAADVDLA